MFTNYSEDAADFESAAKRMMDELSIASMSDSPEEIICENCRKISGPILSSYVLWILKRAEQLKIVQLYFLARDAKILYDLALVFIEKYQLPVQCHYLYCSRLALRKPLYYIDKEEALKKLCVNGLRITPFVVMERTGLSRETVTEIFDDIDIRGEERSAILSEKGLNDLKGRLAKSEVFDREMLALSKKHFENTITYFKQECLFQAETYALVDSGWTGSMQRCIRMILEKAGVKRQMQGFYFGIFCPTEQIDGLYHSFYFGSQWGNWNSILFNHNLLECWCMADHGMTLEYRKDDAGKAVPIMMEYYPLWAEKRQAEFHALYAKHLAEIVCWQKLSAPKLAPSIRRRVRQASIFPKREVAEIYGQIPFCDDSSESYKIPLAEHIPFKNLIQSLLIVRLYVKFISKHKRRNYAESFWPEATITFLPWYQRWPLRMDKWCEYTIKVLRNEARKLRMRKNRHGSL